jgi:RND superfamily putative drug exporter
VRAPAQHADEVRAALGRLVARTQGDPLFAHDETPRPRSSADGRVHTVSIASPYSSSSPEARQALGELRRSILPATIGAVPGAEHAVGGDTADNKEFTTRMSDRLPWVVGSVLLLTFVMMALTFRSVVVAFTTIAINLLSAGAAFGVLVLVFQHHWAEGLLGFRSTGTVVAYMPLLVFAVLFGLSMDYHVFVVSRIREAARRGLPTREAVAAGITSSAGVVTSAAVVMVSVFALFASLSLMEMKQLGVGLAVAILIDAVVVRIVVLPSLMALLGRANWWPSPLSRRPRLAPLAGDRAPVPAERDQAAVGGATVWG